MAEKKKKSIKKKDMTFKEYLEELGGRRKAAMESRIKESFPDEEFDPQEQKTPKPKNMKKGGPVHRMPDGTMMKGAKHGILPATPDTPATPMKRPRRRTGMTKGIDPTGQPRRLTERERLRMIKQGGRYKKRAAVHRMPDGTLMKGAKHGIKAGGYVLSADEKRRRKEFKGAKAVKSNVGKKKMKHGGMVIVDRQYLKGK